MDAYLVLIIILTLIVLSIIMIVNKKKRPPWGFYIALLIYGVVIGYVAGFLSGAAEGFVELFFRKYVYYQNGEMYWTSVYPYLIYQFILQFCIVSFYEEMGKIFVPAIIEDNTLQRTKTSLDCILHFMIIAVAFSVSESYLYIKEYDNGLLRFLITIAGHPLFALVYGVFFVKHRINIKAISIANRLRYQGFEIDNIKQTFFRRKYFFIGILASMLLHATHNFFAPLDEVILFVMVILRTLLFIILFVFVLIQNIQIDKKGEELFLKKYPEFTLEQLIELGIIKSV